MDIVKILFLITLQTSSGVTWMIMVEPKYFGGDYYNIIMVSLGLVFIFTYILVVIISLVALRFNFLNGSMKVVLINVSLKDKFIASILLLGSIIEIVYFLNSYLNRLQF